MEIVGRLFTDGFEGFVFRIPTPPRVLIRSLFRRRKDGSSGWKQLLHATKEEEEEEAAEEEEEEDLFLFLHPPIGW